MFLSEQKDSKIKELEKQVVDLGTRLDKNLKKQILPNGTGGRGAVIKNNPVVQLDTQYHKAAEFELAYPLGQENNPLGGNSSDFNLQQ